MVIRGNSRGNPRQLSSYLLTMKDNEDIRVLDVDGQADADHAALHRAVFAMGISSELSKSDKGLYHAQINPAIGEDKMMDDKHWLQASDILASQLGLENQRRAIVLHSKKGRTHAHVVWERYDHEKEKMVSDSFSRLAQDRARKEMELTFGHNPTPHRNRHRPELKTALSKLWKQTDTGADFVKAANKNGYLISEGSGRSPYMVVDEAGRSYNLTRQLDGARLKDVRQRLRNESLLGEKDAIILARKLADDKGGSGKQKGQDGSSGHKQSQFTIKPSSIMSEEFANNGGDITGKSGGSEKQAASPKEQFGQNGSDIGDKKGQAKTQPQPEPGVKEKFGQNKEATGQQPEKTVQEKFAENKGDAGDSKQQKQEKERAAFKKRMEAIKEKNAKSKDKDKGPDMG